MATETTYDEKLREMSTLKRKAIYAMKQGDFEVACVKLSQLHRVGCAATAQLKDQLVKHMKHGSSN